MSRTTGFDAFTSGQIFRKDFKVVLAIKRELAVILPVRLAPHRDVSQDYQAGEVLAQYNSSAGALNGLFVNYLQTDSGSGRNTATCILMIDVIDQALTSAASGELAPAIFGGIVYQNSLVGSDANALSNLGAKVITDATGFSLVKF